MITAEIKQEHEKFKKLGFNPIILYDAVKDKVFVSLFTKTCYSSLMIKEL